MSQSKRILFIDTYSFQTNARAQLLIDTRHHTVDIADSFVQTQTLYEKGKYDLVLIDFSRDFGLESLRYIDEIDAMQKMITISENEGYSEEKGCDHCIRYHQRRRLKPPFSFPELVRFIENFELTICPHKNHA